MLKTDDPDHPTWDYHVRFEAFPESRIVPEIIDLGAYSVADMLAVNGSQELTIRDAWLEVFSLSDDRDSSLPKLGQIPTECVATMAQTPEVSALANRIRLERYRLSVRSGRASHLLGPSSASSMQSKDDRGPTASITWSVRAPPVDVEPARIHLGSITSKAAPIRRSVLLHSADGLPFRILGIEPGSCCKARLPDGGEFPSRASDRQSFELVFDWAAQRPHVF